MDVVDFELWQDLDTTRQEEINALYTNIQFSGENKTVIGVISSNENEGKTFISMELLRTAANNGKRCILVDADLRKSRIETHYGANVRRGAYKGLTHYLCGEATEEEIIKATNINGAYAILVGQYSVNPMKLLASARFEELLTKLREKYDFILVDMPPLNIVIDGAIVAQKCDGVVLVVQSNVTSYRMVQKSKEQLEYAGADILGVVLNKTPIDSRQYYYSGHYYGRSYGSSQYLTPEEPTIENTKK